MFVLASEIWPKREGDPVGFSSTGFTSEKSSSISSKGDFFEFDSSFGGTFSTLHLNCGMKY